MARDDASVLETVRAFRETINSLYRLYRQSAQQIVDSYSWLVGEEPSKFIQEMEDSHRGLLMKVFGEVAPAGAFESLECRQVGRVLLEHLWGQPVYGADLREKIQWVVQESAAFQWEALVRPFTTLPPLRERWGELNSLITRMANLVAKCDGDIGPSEKAKLQSINDTLQRLYTSASDRFTQSSAPERQVIDQVSRGAKILRDLSRMVDGGSSGDLEEKLPGKGSAFDLPAPTVTPRPERTSGNDSSSTKPTSPKDEEPKQELSPEERLNAALKKLDDLIGLESIKEQVRTLTNFLKLEKLRRQEGLPETKLALHMAFVGNPGTGKTTVARIICEIFGALGILSKGQLVETDRSGLVAEYAGQTGPKTNAKVDEAMDGVLFIDEAYTLVSADSQDQYGREAVQTLLKRMEDARDRLIVILAGYPLEMQMMIRSNPGLSSRIGQTFDFPDYTPGEMGRIFGLMCKKAEYRLPQEARRRVLQGLNYLHARRDRHFGNGRTVRNAFEASVRRLANRLASNSTINRELLTTLEADDIEIPGVTAAHLKALAAHEVELRVTCEQCKQDQQTSDVKLGESIKCNHCQKEFTPQWGEPIPPAEPVAVEKTE